MSRADDNPLAGRIFTIRGQRVILDADLARLYGVSTKRFNEAVKRNAQRFHSDFAFRLNAEEDASLRKRFAAPIVESSGGKAPAPMWSQIATTSKPQRRRLPIDLGPSPSMAQ